MQLDHKLAALLNQAAEFGAMKALVETGALKAKVSKSEAYRRYGRTQVEQWIAKGVIKPVQKDCNGHWELDRQTLASLEASKTLVQFIDIPKNGY